MVKLTNIQYINTNTILINNYDIYLIDASLSDITITLPDITCDGMNFLLLRTDTSSHHTTIIGSNPIYLTHILTGSPSLNPKQTCTIVSLNSGWYLTYANTQISGPTGPTGLTGNIGPTGPLVIGPRGDTGTTGATGAGTQGFEGASGETGVIGLSGATGLTILTNLDLTTGGITGAIIGFDNVGVTGNVNVLDNDITNGSIVSVSISAPPNPKYEGSASVTGSTGTVIFTPAPRLLNGARYGYNVDVGLTGSNLVVTNVNLNYVSSFPSILYTNGTTTINKMDLITGISTPFLTLGSFAPNEIATNTNDALLYLSRGSTIIVYDLILNISWTLITSVATLGIQNIIALEYDNKRNIFWILPGNIATSWAKLAMYPYDRYNKPGVQDYTLTNVTFNVPVTSNVGDAVVESETGYIYVVSISPTSILYKLNPYTGTILAQKSIPSSYPVRGTNNEIYILRANNPIYKLVNTATCTTINTGVPSPTVINDCGCMPFNF